MKLLSDPENILKQSQNLCPYMYAPYDVITTDDMKKFLIQHEATAFLL